MKIIVETDIGHDPDDLFAIAYLAAAGVEIQAITIVPGDPDQVAIARFMLKRLGLDIPVGASKLGREKLSSGSIHHDLLEKYGFSFFGLADGFGHEIIQSVYTPETKFFIIGPATSVGKFCEAKTGHALSGGLMQGGFAPYSIHRPKVILDKFEGCESMATFNLNGDRPNGQFFLSAVMPRYMVGKNICHTVEFNKEVFSRVKSNGTPGAELFIEAAGMYLDKHESKKFHDPTAAALFLHPELGEWVAGKTIKAGSGWTTQLGGEDQILVDVDYDRLWESILEFK